MKSFLSNRCVVPLSLVLIWEIAIVLSFAHAQEPDPMHTHPPAVIGATMTAKDTIPDFAGTPNMWTVKSGAWSDPSTWNLGRVPALADICNIEEEHVITFAGLGECGDLGIRGVLKLDRAGATLKAANILVYRPGRVHAGTAADPATGKVEIIIANRTLNWTTDPLQFGTGLIVFGELKMHGQAKTAWLALAKEAKAGDTTLTLKSAPQGWKAGDRLVLPDTRQWSIVRKASTSPVVPVALRIEEPTVVAVNGNVVTLSAPLAHDHLGGRDSTGTVVSMGHVGNLTRNVAVRSENSQGTRGHTLYTERASIDVRYASFENLGRTTATPIGAGFNQIGRYPVHFHHLMGPRNLNNIGHQFAFVGNVTTDCRKWCIAIHNSHWGLVTDNVVYRADGSGIQTEQANERGNEIDRNFAVKIGTPIVNLYKPIYGGVKTDFKDFGWEGSGFWLAGNDNYVRGNVAANVAFAGFNFNGRACGGFAHCLPLVPKIRGADIAIASEWTDHRKLNIAQPSIIEASNNETYASAEGAWISFNGAAGTFRDFLGWHLAQAGLYTARLGYADFINLRLINNPAVSALQQQQASFGLDIGSPSYNSGRLSFTNIIVEGFNVGLESPANREPLSASLYPGVDARTMEFKNAVFRNYLNVWDTPPAQYGGAQLPSVPKITVFRSSVFSTYGTRPVAPMGAGRPLPMQPLDFYGDIGTNSILNWITFESRLYSYDHQRSGTDVELFFPQQAPNYVMPEILASGSPFTGQRLPRHNCPSVGMTNAQCKVAHGVATLNRLATCGATHPLVAGFLCPVP